VVPAHDGAAWDWYAPEVLSADVVHDFSGSCALVEALHLHQPGVPTLYTRNGIDFSRPRWGRERAVVLSAAARHCAVTGTSAWAGVDAPYDQWAQFPGQLPDARVVHYGVDLTWYHPDPDAPDPDGYWLYVGRPHPSKGVDRILALAARRPRDRFLLAWTPALSDHLTWDTLYRRMAADLENVTILTLPEVGHQTVKRQLLQRARALLQPTRYVEAFGLTAIEALACGTPVVLGRKGSAPEIVQDGVTGALPPPGDQQWDVEAWEAALDRWPTWDRAACRADAEARWGIDRMADAYEQLYCAAVEEGVTW